jgi:hypothetical protein
MEMFLERRGGRHSTTTSESPTHQSHQGIRNSAVKPPQTTALDRYQSVQNYVRVNPSQQQQTAGIPKDTSQSSLLNALAGAKAGTVINDDGTDTKSMSLLCVCVW